MKKAAFVFIIALLAVTSCKKEDQANTKPAPQKQTNENDLFFTQSSTLFTDYQIVYYYLNGKFNDPIFNQGSFPAQNFELKNDSTLSVLIKSQYTSAEDNVTAVKIPIKYDQYGQADIILNPSHPFTVYNGLVYCRSKNMLYAFDSQSPKIYLYFLDNHQLLIKDYSGKILADGRPEIEILGMGNGEKWTIQHNTAAPDSYEAPAIRVENGATTYFYMACVDDKRTQK